MATINNLKTIYTNQIFKIFTTGVSELSDQYATIDYMDNEIFKYPIGMWDQVEE